MAQTRVAEPVDFVKVRKATDLQMSPRGTFGAFVLNTPNQEKSPKWLSTRTIWIKALDQDQKWNQPFTDLAESWSPAWSPNGRRLAFVARRASQSAKPEAAESAQIFIADADGSNPTPLTTLHHQVKAFRWAPDSETIAFIAQAEQKEGAESLGSGKLKLFSVNIHRKLARPVLKDDEHLIDFSWGPDSSTLAVLRNTATGYEGWFAKKSLSLVDIASQRTIKDFTLDTGYFTLIRWSPDGNYVFFLGPSATRASVVPMLLNVKAGTVTALPMSQSGDILEVEWAPDSTSLRTKILDKNNGIIATIDIRTGATTALERASVDWLSESPTFTTFSFSDQGDFLYLKESATSPADVWLSRSGERRKLTALNPDIQNLRLSPIEEVTWRNKNDKEVIHGMLIKPNGQALNTPLPLITLIHGGPYWAWWNGWQEGYIGWGQFLASHGYAVFLPNPRGSRGGGTKYADAIVGDLGGVDYVDIMSGVDSLISSGIADPERLGIGGFSYGGFMTPWAITQTNRFKVAVAGGVIANWKTLWNTSIIPGMFTTLLLGTPEENPELYAERSPVNHAQHASTPTLIYQGTVDKRTPVGQARELYAALKKNKVPTELILFEGEGHYFKDRNNTVKLMEKVLQWYRRYL
ncbi:S9 family peptidase [Synechococcus sp. PROS-7-1]|uniref:S9 family peptidase n=1 Tax=Synechococcus sp. PROS-7-1 TaxID=1442556 RepID=UPI001644FEAD|nr:S9 family peptidase [Synechococcus sp. PROS-7-1]